MNDGAPRGNIAAAIGWRLAVVVLAPLAFAACAAVAANRAAEDDVWHPKGLNAANLAATVQNPADLVQGRGDTGPERKLAAHAVIQLWTNPTATLLQSGASAGGGTPSAMQPLGGGDSAATSAGGVSGGGAGGAASSGSGN